MMKQHEIEEFVTRPMWPLSLLIAGGRFKRLRANPWIRGGAGVFAAATSAIWERDRQVDQRRCLLELSRNRDKRRNEFTQASLMCSLDNFLISASLILAGYPDENRMKKDRPKRI